MIFHKSRGIRNAMGDKSCSLFRVNRCRVCHRSNTTCFQGKFYIYVFASIDLLDRKRKRSLILVAQPTVETISGQEERREELKKGFIIIILFNIRGEEFPLEIDPISFVLSIPPRFSSSRWLLRKRFKRKRCNACYIMQW